MRIRERTYWQWADAQLPCRSHDERLSDGTSIDVQVRLSRTGATQMFLGVYSRHGRAMVEEYYDNRPGENMIRAMVWGVDRARALLTDGFSNLQAPLRRQA